VLKRTLSLDLTGVRVAVNIFVAGTLLWLILREFQQLNPIWAISSMIAASDPVVETAWKFLRGRLTNALVGCGTGLVILFVGGTSEWKIPIAVVGERPDLDLCRARAGDVAAGPDHGDHRRGRRARGPVQDLRDAARRRARRRRAARLPGGVHGLVRHVPALAGDERRRGRLTER
jgi:hypothetical protein